MVAIIVDKYEFSEALSKRKSGLQFTSEGRYWLYNYYHEQWAETGDFVDLGDVCRSWKEYESVEARLSFETGVDCRGASKIDSSRILNLLLKNAYILTCGKVMLLQKTEAEV